MTVLKIDGVSYDVPIVSLKRKADILDRYATRSEDGELHREVIGTFYNYTLEIKHVRDLSLYESLFYVLSAPVPSHSVELPNENVAFDGYFSSISDEVALVDDNGVKYKNLTCRLTGMRPRRRG